MSTAATTLEQTVQDTFFVFTYRPAPPVWEYALRFVATFVMLLIVGLERQATRKPLGFGPFTLVGVSACASAILAIIIAPTGPLPLMSGTISGISFLGAGALIRSGDGGVQGFTTGSMLVLSAFIGINMGSGMYLLAVLLWFVQLLIIGIDRVLQRRSFGAHGFRVSLNFTIGSAVDAELVTASGTGYRTPSSSSSSSAADADGSGGDTLLKRRMAITTATGGTAASYNGLALALNGSQRVLSAFKSSGFKCYMQELKLDDVQLTKQTTAKLTLIVQAQRQAVTEFLATLNVHLARRSDHDGDNEHIEVTAMSVTLPS